MPLNGVFGFYWLKYSSKVGLFDGSSLYISNLHINRSSARVFRIFPSIFTFTIEKKTFFVVVVLDLVHAVVSTRLRKWWQTPKSVSFIDINEIHPLSDLGFSYFGVGESERKIRTVPPTYVTNHCCHEYQSRFFLISHRVYSLYILYVIQCRQILSCVAVSTFDNTKNTTITHCHKVPWIFYIGFCCCCYIGRWDAIDDGFDIVVSIFHSVSAHFVYWQENDRFMRVEQFSIGRKPKDAIQTVNRIREKRQQPNDGITKKRQTTTTTTKEEQKKTTGTNRWKILEQLFANGMLVKYWNDDYFYVIYGSCSVFVFCPLFNHLERPLPFSAYKNPMMNLKMHKCAKWMISTPIESIHAH